MLLLLASYCSVKPLKNRLCSLQNIATRWKRYAKSRIYSCVTKVPKVEQTMLEILSLVSLVFIKQARNWKSTKRRPYRLFSRRAHISNFVPALTYLNSAVKTGGKRPPQLAALKVFPLAFSIPLFSNPLSVITTLFVTVTNSTSTSFLSPSTLAWCRVCV